MKRYKNLIYLALLLLVFNACRKLPEKRNYLSPNASLSLQQVYEPILGRTTLYLSQFNGDGSTYPLEFSLENARHAGDGSPAPELFQKINIQEWRRDYTGLETSMAQIDSERIWVEKPFFEIRKGSGDFIFWNAASSVIASYPDSGYIFDVKVQNLGNERVFKDLSLRPIKEVPYQPYEYDLYTRKRKSETRIGPPPESKSYTVPFTIHPNFVNNLYYTKDSLFTDSLVSVYFYKTETQKEQKTLTFKFLDQQFDPISLDKFNETKWDSLVHGFNMRKTDSTVTFDVAYPIPLTELNTPFAKGGQAQVVFGYSRKGYGGVRVDATFGLNFSIFDPGDWTIIFYFRRTPRFEDE